MVMTGPSDKGERLWPRVGAAGERLTPPRFQRLGDRVTCGVVVGFTVCVPARDSDFREALKRAPPAPFSQPLPASAGPSH
ncbi:hypothetical protein MVI01_40380 [Myxococcus virescens]|uniref:Uncharacterized protein n=2 Tax=Myxococcus virescens TaxID=83456 RepID=A0A511HFT5_9BACT|nr:hypothetical protein MVI01_40380 [Myxococcus virescens]